MGLARLSKQSQQTRTFLHILLNKPKKLQKKIAEKLNLDEDNVLLGNGIDGLIAEISRAVLTISSHVVLPQVTFPNMMFTAKLCGAAISYVSMENEIYLNLKQFKHVIRANTKIVYLCNPNNPTGEYLSPESIINNLYSDDYILIVDEANIEFCNAARFLAQLCAINGRLKLVKMLK
ncbi:aminotransferase class I/II-fold pyridoxal phosphate-dependent enzyme [Marinomonas sp. 2405UD68-3]|uniref:aminotransferase class I/II-fold pyridoxal phosphate-dependent enzyme n=1 Tax=Marinomonas sp. 2405UD68-3 TaxID=3391835 RepID=UPI0039C91DDC